ncbi:hypothetical protein BH10BDE1_BH10BDE1_17000 [soil metagenome]
MTFSKTFKVHALQALIAFGGLLVASTSNAQFHGGGRGGGHFGGGAAGNWTYCTAENTVCRVNGVNDVAYGANGSWTYRQNVRGAFNCNNNTFGDPISGTTKACWIQPSRMSPPPGGPGGPGGPGWPGGRPPVIRVQSATYGANVRAGVNNAWNDVAQKCNGLRECNYLVSVRNLGDPAPGRRKDFLVEFTCDRTPQRPVSLPPEADGQVAHLRCF